MQSINRPTNVAEIPNIDMEKITTQAISEIRNLMDTVSWTMLKDDEDGDPNRILRRGALNAFLIESFNEFGTEGLASFFRNRELTFGNVALLRFGDHILQRPRKTQSGNPNDPLWPNEARILEMDYAGELIVKAKIFWLPASGRDGEDEVLLSLGNIPIMLGSKFCNLSSITSKEDLVAVGECSTDYMGYFVIKGNERFLISQNYLRPNHDMVIASKMGSSQNGRRTCCNIRSAGYDGMMTMHRAFIAKNSTDKITHSDRRIYIQMPWTLENAYDRGGASSTGISAIGVNIISVFRMAHVLIRKLDPTMPKQFYQFASFHNGDRLMEGGYRGTSTFGFARDSFVNLVKEYAGDKLFDLARNYIEDTVNEASIEIEEEKFWEQCYLVSGHGKSSKTSSSKKAATDEEEEAPTSSISDRAEIVLTTFGDQFFPHLSQVPFSNQRRMLEDKKTKIRQFISERIRAKITNLNPSQLDNYVDFVLVLMMTFVEIQRNLGFHPQDSQEYKANLDKLKLIREQLSGQFGVTEFPQIYIESVQLIESVRRDAEAKMNLLAYMAARVLRVELGVDSYDDRDNLSNQMHENAGMLMMTRFVSMMRDLSKDSLILGISQQGQKSTTAEAIRNNIKEAASTHITKGFSKNFSDGTWNTRKATIVRTGVTEIMPTVLAARISSLRRISAQSGGHSKNTEARNIAGLQTGFICVSETPEGKQCGNVEHLAVSAFITNESRDSETLAFRFMQLESGRHNMSTADILNVMNRGTLQSLTLVKDTKGETYISKSRTLQRDTPFFLNGRPLGWVDGLVFRRFLIDQRRKGLIHPYAGVHYLQKASKTGMIKCLNLETTGGRIVQPLIIAEDPQRTVNFLYRLIDTNPARRITTFQEMVSNGMIEYIDAGELEFLDLAPSASDYLRAVKDGFPERFDHIMLNPAFLMGVSANLMPFANMNPVVRNSYFTQMVKQPIGVPLPTYKERTYSKVSVLHTPQVPLVRTDMYDGVFGNNYWGMNVKILIRPHLSGQEDGIVINEDFIKRGGLSSTKYSIFTMDVPEGRELNFVDGFMDSVENPDNYGRGVIRTKKQVITTDENGNQVVKEEPVIVRPNEILAMHTRQVGNNIEMKSLKFESLRDGIVDNIMWVKYQGGRDEKNGRKLHISIKMEDSLWIGDKLAAQHSQKGVIAAVISNDDMPYDEETGERADLIINPQAFPSRGTVAMMAELLVANAHAYPDKNKICWILYNVRGFDIYCPFERIFIVDEQEWKKYQSADEEVPISSGETAVRELFNPQPVAPGPTIPTKPIWVSSEEVYDDFDMNWLRSHDMVANGVRGYETGMWVLRFYGERKGQNTEVEEKKRSGRRVSLEEAKSVDPRGAKFILVSSDGLNDAIPRIPQEELQQGKQTLGVLIKESGIIERMAFAIDINGSDVEAVRGLNFDLERDPVTQQFINPQKAVRLSRLPKVDIPDSNNDFQYLGKNIHDIYLRGNSFTPIPTQYIAGYLDSFFRKGTLQEYFIDFIIPEDARTLENLIIPGRGLIPKFNIMKGTTYSTLRKERLKIKALRDGKEIETTLPEIWNATYSEITMIPRQNVIDLPENARDIFVIRREKIESLRRATIFKEGVDINDAMRELKMMGYSPDMKSTFIDPKTKKPIEGGIVSGYVYEMALSHKVMDKVQGRGFGKREHLLWQPIAGRNFEGGIRFNHNDALAVIRSGAVNFIADRLLNASSKADVYVCTKCDSTCYKEQGGLKGIVCPQCKVDAKAVKITVPYSFLLQKNLLAGAGVNLKIKAVPEEEEDE